MANLRCFYETILRFNFVFDALYLRKNLPFGSLDMPALLTTCRRADSAGRLRRPYAYCRRNATTAADARCSCRKLSAALTTRSAIAIQKSVVFPKTNDSAAISSSIHADRPQNFRAKLRKGCDFAAQCAALQHAWRTGPPALFCPIEQPVPTRAALSRFPARDPKGRGGSREPT